jgi:hypothetical protein
VRTAYNLSLWGERRSLQLHGKMQANKKSEMQQAMIWNMRCLRSGFGKQTYSHKATEPSTPMGSGSRDAHLRARTDLTIAPENSHEDAIRCVTNCTCLVQLDLLCTSASLPLADGVQP